MIGRDGIAGLVCLVGSLGMLLLTRGLPQAALVPIGPGFYPRLVLTATAILSAALLISDLRRSARAPSRPPRSRRLVVVAFTIFAAYVVAMPYVGYRVATLGFVAALQAAIEPPRGRGWLLVAAVALTTTIVTYYLFEVYLSVLLPRGRLTGF